MEGVAVCEFCGDPAEPGAPGVLYAISGFEEIREQGGANMIHLRNRLGPVAHLKCVEDAKPRQLRRRREAGPKLDVSKKFRGRAKAKKKS
jgi:hypothetical protein